jgi:hypothetical protein
MSLRTALAGCLIDTAGGYRPSLVRILTVVNLNEEDQ